MPRLVGLLTTIQGLVVFGVLSGWAAPALADATHADAIAAGKAIYEQGILRSGAELVAKRDGGIEMRGATAACISCHRRSGLGVAEGSVVVPPITAAALFQSGNATAAKPRRATNMTSAEYDHRTRPAYTMATLAVALRLGASTSGHKFKYLMPRFELGDADMTALVAYLGQLSAALSDGVEADAIHFATVVAPDQDPARAAAMIEVVRTCFAERYPEGRGNSRAWRLHVWTLGGAPESWNAQLRQHYAMRPVFSLVAGLGGGTWQPVHTFCQSEQMPCLFPNVDVPGDDAETEPTSQYNFYFSKGVVLEAEVLARYLGEQSETRKPRRIVQLSKPAGTGATAAAALRRALGSTMAIEDRAITSADRDAVSAALVGIEPDDVLIVWLAGAELDALFAVAPPPAGLILGSTRLGSLARVRVAPAWMEKMQFVYPFDAPARLDARMSFNLRPWLLGHNLAIVDERLQGDTHAACSLMAESMGRMRGSYVRERLVELVETYPAAMGNAPAAQSYPRFTIGPGQRFSSKGAYIVRYGDRDSPRLELVQDWIVP